MGDQQHMEETEAATSTPFIEMSDDHEKRKMSLEEWGGRKNVVAELMREFLVVASVERVLAYRRYREQKGAYWTAEKLESLHWECLYGQVTLDMNLLDAKRRCGKALESSLVRIRAILGAAVGIAEELVPLHSMRDFSACTSGMPAGSEGWLSSTTT